MKHPFLICAVSMAMVGSASGQSAPASGQSLPAVLPPTTASYAQADGHGMFVVFLGTGTPRPNPARQGPSLAVIVNGKAYIVDSGTGVVRQAAAAYLRGVSALQPNKLDMAFLTHLHSDHTLGLPDLILMPWVMHRITPLTLYGPVGTKAMVDGIETAYAEDIDVRTHGLEHNSKSGHQVVVHEIQPGVVYQDDNVKITAFEVKHGSLREALGYRFDADGKSVVISGDTRPVKSVVDACNGCDVLIHEAYDSTMSENPYFSSFHTSGVQLGKIAAAAKPKLLVVTHYVGARRPDPSEVIPDIQQNFRGTIAAANDLDVIAP